jgi:hypothetical protein
LTEWRFGKTIPNDHLRKQDRIAVRDASLPWERSA